jgi:hypothetical protein
MGLLSETPSAFHYTSDFKGNEWVETFTDSKAKTRTHKQTLYPYTMEEIASFAKRYDLKQIHQYAGGVIPLEVLVFQKKS